MSFQLESYLVVAYSTHFQQNPQIISVTWSINFQMALLFFMSLSSIYLFSIQQLKALIAEM